MPKSRHNGLLEPRFKLFNCRLHNLRYLFVLLNPLSILGRPMTTPHLPYPPAQGCRNCRYGGGESAFTLSILKQSGRPNPWEMRQGCTTLVSIWCGSSQGMTRPNTTSTRERRSLSTLCQAGAWRNWGKIPSKWGRGDFMGFVPGGLPHNLHNPFDEDLVYLVGGMRLDFDICDYPRVGQRLYRSGLKYDYVNRPF